MRKLILVIVTAYLAAITIPAVQAGNTVYQRQRWADPGNGWYVDYVAAINSCVVGRSHTNGVNLQIVYHRSDKSFSMMLLNRKWQNIEDDADYTLRLVMDGGADSWRGAARGIWANDGNPGITMSNLKLDFLRSFMARNRIDFYNLNSGAFITALLLDGSTAAMQSEIACLDAHGGPSGPNTSSNPQLYTQ